VNEIDDLLTDFAVDLEEDRSFHAVIDHNSVHLRKGTAIFLKRAEINFEWNWIKFQMIEIFLDFRISL